MNDKNKVQLEGRLTKDAEVSYLESGTMLVAFTLANNYYIPRGEGNYEQRVNFIRVVSFGERAEKYAKLGKGEKVEIEGVIRTSQWEELDGTRRYSTYVQAM